MSLLQRLNVAIDVVFAIDYLHKHSVQPLIHCDLKPSNVLLDNDMVAHVSDFGLASLLPITNDSSKKQTSTIGINGSIGYVAPGNFFWILLVNLQNIFTCIGLFYFRKLPYYQERIYKFSLFMHT